MKKVISFLIALLLALNFSVCTTYSYVPAPEDSEEEDAVKNVEHWAQGLMPYTGDELIHNMGGSSSIKNAACSHFAMSYALVKMGYLNPEDGDTPMTHIELARENKAFYTEWGYYNFAKAPDMYEGVTYEGRRYVSHLGKNEGLEYVKDLMNEGYYVIGIVVTPDTGGHCIFFDEVLEDGDVSIGDSWFEGTKWSDYYGDTDTRWSYLEVLSCDGKPSNEQPSIYYLETEETELEDIEIPKSNIQVELIKRRILYNIDPMLYMFNNFVH